MARLGGVFERAVFERSGWLARNPRPLAQVYYYSNKFEINI
jgi:hypothetical protein